jgi:AraC-like DNA-binding protein
MRINREVVRRRLECLLSTDAGLNVSLAEIEATTGIAGRTLRQYCQEWWGTGLLHYIRVSRLARIRRELERFDPLPRSTADVAALYGMHEPGRFAGQYRRQFGEAPSTTLKRTQLQHRATAQRGLC